MIALTQIETMLAHRAFGQLVRRILENGRGASEPIRDRLLRPECVLPAALGLALQRGCELTYGPVPATLRLARRIVRLERPNGLFRAADRVVAGADKANRPAGMAAIAVVVRGLIEFTHQLEAAGTDQGRRIGSAAARAIRALAAGQRSSGLIGRDAIDSAIVAWQLGGEAEFRRAVRFDALCRAMGSAAEGLLLCPFARHPRAAA